MNGFGGRTDLGTKNQYLAPKKGGSFLVAKSDVVIVSNSTILL